MFSPQKLTITLVLSYLVSILGCASHPAPLTAWSGGPCEPHPSMVVDGAQIVTFRPGVAYVEGYKVGTIKDYWVPSADDVRRIEARIQPCIAAALPRRSAEMQDYARQYSGFYLDGRKRVFVQLFRHPEAYPNWRCVPVVVDDGGDNYLHLEYDFESDRCENIYVNGGA